MSGTYSSMNNNHRFAGFAQLDSSALIDEDGKASLNLSIAPATIERFTCR